VSSCKGHYQGRALYSMKPVPSPQPRKQEKSVPSVSTVDTKKPAAWRKCSVDVLTANRNG